LRRRRRCSASCAAVRVGDARAQPAVAQHDRGALASRVTILNRPALAGVPPDDSAAPVAGVVILDQHTRARAVAGHGRAADHHDHACAGEEVTHGPSIDLLPGVTESV
jgi:hypothetical protein